MASHSFNPPISFHLYRPGQATRPRSPVTPEETNYIYTAAATAPRRPFSMGPPSPPVVDPRALRPTGVLPSAPLEGVAAEKTDLVGRGKATKLRALRLMRK